MNNGILNKTEIKTLQEIESKYYMQPILDYILQDIKSNNREWQKVFDNI